jgi:hypothetical protein
VVNLICFNLEILHIPAVVRDNDAAALYSRA